MKDAEILRWFFFKKKCNEKILQNCFLCSWLNNVIFISLLSYILKSWTQEHRDCLKKHSDDITVIIQVVQTALR